MARDLTLVVGGGVIGLACAAELAELGHRVRVVDRAPAGTGASVGNAGWVTQSQSLPVPSPDSLRDVLRSAGRPDAPLYVRPSLSWEFARWLWESRRFCTPEEFTRGAHALGELAAWSVDLFDKWQAAGVETSLSHPGLLHAFLHEAEAERTLATQRMTAAGRYALPDTMLSTSQALALEPALSAQVKAAYLVPGEGLVDPRALVSSLVDRVRSLGGTVESRRCVTRLRVGGGRVRAAVVDGTPIPVDRVVMAAGAWSGGLLRDLGVRVRLQAGKGYSFSVALSRPPIRPLYLGDKHVAVSPLGGTTRIAGTMEFSGNNLRLDWRRVEAIAHASRHYLGDWFADRDELMALIRDPWVGGRPMLPDGLPLIDRVPTVDNAFIATGHGMLGVTLAPATGAALGEYITVGARPTALEPFSFARRGLRA
jgi:glycine/D-amino acid oxidase-like deaminating enzyme